MSFYLKLSVFIAGASVMGAEMCAPRLAAPAFGTTQLVWTLIIATVLAALTVGAVVGGRLADRWPVERSYARVLVLAGMFVALIPFVGRPLLLAAGRALAEQAGASYFALLALLCLLFAPPVFLLGMIPPWAIRIAGADRSDLGGIAGTLTGLGALGSIVGTFGASLVAIPSLGTRRTLLAFAALLIATGAAKATAGRGRSVAAAGAAAGLALLPLGPVRSDPGIVFEVESLYQYLQVRAAPGGRAELRLNDGVGVQSVALDAGPLTGGIWDYLAALPALVPERREPLRVLILGLAGGTSAQQIEAIYGAERGVSLVGVEIDPAVVDAARRYFDLDRVASLSVHVADGRTFVEACEDTFDVVIVDAYQGFYVPFQLATREFYERAGELLAPGGIVGVNVAAPRSAVQLLEAHTRTLASVYPHLGRLEVVNHGVPFSNFLYLASFEALPAQPARRLPRALAGAVGRAFQHRLETPRAPPDAPLFTDDHAPLEQITDRALLRLAFSS